MLSLCFDLGGVFAGKGSLEIDTTHKQGCFIQGLRETWVNGYANLPTAATTYVATLTF